MNADRSDLEENYIRSCLIAGLNKTEARTIVNKKNITHTNNYICGISSEDGTLVYYDAVFVGKIFEEAIDAFASEKATPKEKKIRKSMLLKDKLGDKNSREVFINIYGLVKQNCYKTDCLVACRISTTWLCLDKEEVKRNKRESVFRNVKIFDPKRKQSASTLTIKTI